ncbi:prominin-like protein isoform X2 [Euwallacea fornicatus]|uniref:prominin-like protein isoform X2 n=1 Tax=Euwallacea fornicatus TaxID=995702 RepID=UPI00338DA5DA
MKKSKERRKRHAVNAASAFLSFALVILAVQLSDGGGQFAVKINDIARNFHTAVIQLKDNVTYSDYVDNATYFSSTKFNAAGMGGLYKLTKGFVNAISPTDIFMDGLISLNDNNVEINLPSSSKIAKYYSSLIAIVVFLVLCIVLFPVCGLFFCCCRCCGNCGAKPQASDKNKDTTKKVVAGTLLILCGTGLLFCIVCAFTSNQQLHVGLDKFPENMNTSIVDVTTYMNTTNNHIYHLLHTNYNEFADVLTELMNNGSNITMEYLKEYTNASAVSTIYQFVDNLNAINDTLYDMKNQTNKLRVYASQLNDALRKVKWDLTTTLTECGLLACKELLTTISQLQTNIHFNKVPDLSSTIKSLDELNVIQLTKDVKSGIEKLDDIQKQINSSVTTGLSAAKKQLNTAGETIKTNLDRVTNTIDEAKKQILSSTSSPIDTSKNYIKLYGKYRYYVGIAISCALLLVTVCILLGLICGVCGKRPDGYSDNCCNKGAGSNFLLCAVFIMFLLGFIISIITLAALLSGVISEKAICAPLRNPNSNNYTVIRLLDNYNFNLDVDIKPSTLMSQCHQNMSIYQTFNLSTKFDLDKIESEYNISDALNSLNLTNVSINADLVLINETVFDNLGKFAPQINVEGFMDELSHNLTNYNLDQLASTLESIIASLGSSQESLKSNLQLSLLHLRTYEDKLIDPMKSLSEDLIDNAKSVSEQIKMGYNNFSEAVENLKVDVERAQTILRVNGTKVLNESAHHFINVTEHLINEFIDRVKDHVENKIGQCGPLSLVINGTLTSTCDKVLLPWNGFWFSLFWTIVLYVLTIIIAVKLANLYQKHKPYDHYVEAEYLYDAYADRGDNIPLNSRGGKRSKKKGKKGKRYDERPSSGRDLGRNYPAGSNPPDARYADMAPKQWVDFPNGGPPHYQRAPTEYERPPPYYYPGSGGDH